MTRRQRIADLTTFALPSQPALSPDGREVVYVLSTVDAAADENVRSLWCTPVPASSGPDAHEARAAAGEGTTEPEGPVATGEGTNEPEGWPATRAGGRAAGRGTARQLTRGRDDSAPAWSPDGSTIAFLRADGRAANHGAANHGAANHGAANHGSAGHGPAQIWLLPRDGGEPEQVTTLPLGAGAPVWSPDGTRIAFGAPVDPRAVPGEDDAARVRRANAPLVAERLDYQADGAGLLGPVRRHLHVLDLASGQVRQVTRGDWHASDPVWSPGSALLAFAAATAQDADLNLRAPVYVVDVSGADGAAEPVLAALADGYGAPAAWTPDGTALLVAGVTDASGLAGHTRLLRVPVPTGLAPDTGRDRGSKRATAPAADANRTIYQDSSTAVSVRPGDRGSSAADTAAPDPRSQPGAAAARAGMVDLAGSLDRNVMPGGPGYPGGVPRFAGGGDSVLFCVRDRGCTHLYAVPGDGSGEPEPVVAGVGRVVSGLSVAGSTAVVVLATPTSYGEIAAVDLATGAVTVITAHCRLGGSNAPKGATVTGESANKAEQADATGAGAGSKNHGGQEDVELYVRQEREFTISDGTVVQGWLIRDPAASGPQPLLLDIHGGPHNAWNGAADPAHLYHQELAARGWTVLLLNPRASDGYGEAFYTAARGAWGVADTSDFLEPLDALVAEGVADPARLAVTGYSYGGFMTCYLTSRDRRFAAAVAGGVVSDLTSMAGTSDDGHLLSAWELAAPHTGDAGDTGTGGTGPGDAGPGGTGPGTAGTGTAGTGTAGTGTVAVVAAAARGAFAAMSPLTRVGDVTTPTLIMHGGADLRCPVGQAQQWFTALREQGVPARLVLYPGASHLFILDGTPSHRIDYNQRVVDWVEQYASQAGDRAPRPIDAAHWERRLAVLAERHKVPGAALGILRLGTGHEAAGGGADEGADEIVEAAYGYANWPAKIEATTDTLFQIGSMSKVWTATLAMQLVDEGKLDLDAPVAGVLPELRLADPEVAKTVTMRHLLSHTSGIDGDVFTDTGRGDDCLEKYVALLSEQKQNHPLGVTWSYCNAGFVLAGRVIEKLTGLTWDEALRQRICTPLGLKHTATLAEDVLLHRAAAGHVARGGEDQTGDPVLAPVWQLPRSLGPAGLISSAPADVLAFARMHLAGGLAADGTRVLSAESARAMTEFEAELPDKYTLGDSWGIGWIRFGWDGHRLVGHDGNTIGQAAFLRVLPASGNAAAGNTAAGNTGAGLAVTLLTNGGNARDLYYDLYTEIFAELADIAMPPALEPPVSGEGAVEADITPHLGRYERAGVIEEVLAGTDKHDGPTLRITHSGPIAELLPDPVEEYPMTPAGPDLWLVREPGTQTWAPVTFYALPTGEKYLHFGVRATPKA